MKIANELIVSMESNAERKFTTSHMLRNTITFVRIHLICWKNKLQLNDHMYQDYMLSNGETWNLICDLLSNYNSLTINYWY